MTRKRRVNLYLPRPSVPAQHVEPSALEMSFRLPRYTVERRGGCTVVWLGRKAPLRAVEPHPMAAPLEQSGNSWMSEEQTFSSPGEVTVDSLVGAEPVLLTHLEQTGKWGMTRYELRAMEGRWSSRTWPRSEREDRTFDADPCR